MDDFFIDEWLEDAMEPVTEHIYETIKMELNCAGSGSLSNSSIESVNSMVENENEETEITDAGQFMFPAIPYWWWEVLKNSLYMNFRCGNVRQFPEEKEGLETLIFEWSYASRDFYALANLLSEICEYIDNSEDCYIIYQGYGMGGAISASSIKNKKAKKFTIILSYTRKCPCCTFDTWWLNESEDE
jgi:hypothetical protein